MRKKKNNQQRVQVLARIPKTLREAVKAKADSEGMYVTDVIEALLSKWAKSN